MAKALTIYVDTSVYVDLLTRNTEPHKESGEPRWKVAKALFDAVNDDRVTLAASSLIDAEVSCAGAVRDGGPAIVQQVRGWFTAASTEWTDVDRFLARDAGQLAKEWHKERANRSKRLGGADATHLAAAVRLGCDYLMTHDEAFPLGHMVSGVRVARPTIVWDEHLLDGISTDQPDAVL
ncbi:MAG: PIN domain-containing protein [Candidatus Phosphoribacter baldrii]